MTDLLEKLEAMGRTGGAIAAAGGGLVLALAIGLAAWTFVVDPEEWGRWGTGGVRFLALMIGALGMVYTMVGIRLLTRREYPSAAEVFPPLEREAFIAALTEQQGEICVCTDCRVVVPIAFSTGSCPVCASSVNYHEVRNEEDAEILASAVH